MSTLHVLSHSPFTDTRLSSCLRLLGEQDAVLLCGDAIYALTESSAPCKALETQRGKSRVFALDEDITARGLPVQAWVQVVDYAAFVELSIRFDRVNTWL
ncbi:sulfurtransferase complex subunit TusB [Pseudomonas huanghezhanensis]|uniref:sulfurtransferase complex subunit TusB n=1 Tax=Pseudomonas huanghezhanensis TaxID=3002903 RepID=UPI0022858F57|nr:sulfurtransferase complex subunit TusB [Pseudomonas sp. BSw22131]